MDSDDRGHTARTYIERQLARKPVEYLASVGPGLRGHAVAAPYVAGKPSESGSWSKKFHIVVGQYRGQPRIGPAHRSIQPVTVGRIVARQRVDNKS